MKKLLIGIAAIFVAFNTIYGADCDIGKWHFNQVDLKEQIPSSVSDLKDTAKWKINKDFWLNRYCWVSTHNFSAYYAAEFVADEDYLESLSIISGAYRLYVNGKHVLPIPQNKNMFEFKLNKGSNLVVMRFDKPKPNPKKKKQKGDPAWIRANSTLTTIAYIYPKVQHKIDRARLALNYFKEKYPDYPADKYLAQLKQLEAKNAKESEVDAFRYEALVKNNPEITLDKLLLRKSGSTNFPANWRGNSHYLNSNGRKHKPRFDDEIRTLDIATRKQDTLYKAKDVREGLMDLSLDFDAKKFLYSGVDIETNTFELYEMNIDGTGKRRISPKIECVDNYNGIYLPNGKILFCSTASMNSVPCVGGADYVGTLYEINKDGTGMQQLTFDQENDWYPWVKENGRVMYSRWEYTDASHYFTRILLEMNPDGTNNRSIYGSNSFWPNSLFYAKQIPGRTSQFSAIVSGHHGLARQGELVIFDSSISDFEAEGALRRIPGRGKKVKPDIVDHYVNGKWPRFIHPYPLSENFFLVSGQIKPGDKFKIYLVDTFDNMVPVAEDPRQHLFEPIPLQPRKCPPVIPDMRRPDQKDATLFIQDIYHGPGLEDIPKGTITGIRIFAYGYAYREIGGHDALAIEGGWDTKRLLGTAPVEKDGSCMVTIPAGLPISIQPIDEKGQAFQIMRSWLAAQPGETVGCIGCHEPSTDAPLPKRAIAASKPPSKLSLYGNGQKPYGFGFRREVQPVLDRNCVGCHDGSNKNIPLNLKNIEERKFKSWRIEPHFSESYLALHPYVRRPGPESDLHLLTPMEYHASTSPLMQLLDKGHHGVKLSDEDRFQLVTWIDLNVPYHATWTELRNDAKTQHYAKRTIELKKKYAGIDDDIEWMPPVPEKRPEFIKPAKCEPPKELELAGWPLNNPATNPERKTIKIGSESIELVKIPAGKFVMGGVIGAPDEYPQAVVEIKKPFWMSTTEITNKQFRQFNPKHDSKVIDQQWKDHIYAGYPGNEPQMPAVRLTWKSADAFCYWLSKKSGLNVKLPTEAQWEWAARAGSDKAHFCNRNELDKYANIADKNIGLLAVRGVDPKPIPENQRTPLTDFVPRDKDLDDGRLVPDGTAQYKSNAFGLYDMIGNVAEWTRSDYKAYPYVDNDGRNDKAAKTNKVARGGSWRDKSKYATVTYRQSYAPYQKVFNVGFRIIIEE